MLRSQRLKFCRKNISYNFGIALEAEQEANDNADDNADNNPDAEAEEDETEEKVWYEKGKLLEPLNKVAFSTIVFDECQYVRRPLSTYGWLARLLQADAKILASATPFLNIIQDIWGALTILTEHAKIGRCFYLVSLIAVQLRLLYTFVTYHCLGEFLRQDLDNYLS
ncbi:hypothetical protein CMQ_8084 [Grosmannia clavigera kw1407]|uniref:Helicase ATP-binding domain-containing protein n=1 Tax=Grosmannia clavigera (strain kw1407 / UAMH 11150) TaxID=655863 RepID=F0XKY3_GROCL|nr:uncharacterized protein CMQ_8084 [Grosmannia clavigera kw1407]EFX01618.1 hypothetical protein CMQ_8084 [Grosmannia clavigera kw1407]